MAMSDCPYCWSTPCECGWGYVNWDKERLIRFRDVIQRIIDNTADFSAQREIERKYKEKVDKQIDDMISESNRMYIDREYK